MDPNKYDYWTHKDLEDSDLEASSASGSDSDEEEIDNESRSDDSDFMDNVNVDCRDEKSMKVNL